jgi:hypothetical protein
LRAISILLFHFSVKSDRLLEEALVAYRNALMERTRERVPLNWGESFGQQGVTLMHLAERTKDIANAEVAFHQIEAALQKSRDGGHTPLAAYFEARLPEALRIRDALKIP